MMSTERRPRRAGLVLGCVAVCGCFFVPAHYSSFASLTFACILAPVQQHLAAGGRALAAGLSDFFSSRSAARENRKLREDVANLRAQLEFEIAASKAKDDSLRMLGAFAEHRQQFVLLDLADVIGEGAGAQRGIVFINRGSQHHVREGMVAVAGHSVIGRVRAVAPSVSSVLLLTSPGSRFDAEITATGEPGVLVGRGDGTMRMKYISRAQPKPDSAVVARGRDGVTPKGYLLGLVSSSRRVRGSLAYEVIVKPAADMDRLASVVVVKPAVSAADFPREPAPTDEGARYD